MARDGIKTLRRGIRVGLALGLTVALQACGGSESECANDEDCAAGQVCRPLSELPLRARIDPDEEAISEERRRALEHRRAPVSSNDRRAQHGVVVAVTRRAIHVGREEVVELGRTRNGLDVDPSQKRGGAAGREIIPLSEKLYEIRDALQQYEDEGNSKRDRERSVKRKRTSIPDAGATARKAISEGTSRRYFTWRDRGENRWSTVRIAMSPDLPQRILTDVMYTVDQVGFRYQTLVTEPTDDTKPWPELPGGKR